MSFITTIIPAYNAMAFLEATLDSLAKQSRRPDRVVLLDDQSTDGTPEFAASYPFIRIDVVRNERNLGLFGNHQRAIQFSSNTDYLHVLHADDTVAPAFFETLLSFLVDAKPGAMAYCEHEFIDAKGAWLKSAVYPLPRGEGEVDRRTFLIDQSELRSIQLHSVILKTGRQPPLADFQTDMPQAGDVAFHVRWAARCPAIFRTDRILAQVRLHGNNATLANARKLESWVLDEWRVMNLAASFISESRLSRWKRRFRLKLIWAARSVVKSEMVGRADGEYARAIQLGVRRHLGPGYWSAGRLAVWVRNACVGTR